MNLSSFKAGERVVCRIKSAGHVETGRVEKTGADGVSIRLPGGYFVVLTEMSDVEIERHAGVVEVNFAG